MDRKRGADGNFVPQSGWLGQGRHSKESTYRRTRHGDLLSKQSLTLRTFGPYRSSCRRRGDLIELVTSQKILYRAYAESRDAMGGAKDQIDCFADLRQNKQMEVLRLGWKNDILHLYGIIRNANGEIIALQQLQWIARDNALASVGRVRMRYW